MRKQMCGTSMSQHAGVCGCTQAPMCSSKVCQVGRKPTLGACICPLQQSTFTSQAAHKPLARRCVARRSAPAPLQTHHGCTTGKARCHPGRTIAATQGWHLAAVMRSGSSTNGFRKAADATLTLATALRGLLQGALLSSLENAAPTPGISWWL